MLSHDSRWRPESVSRTTRWLTKGRDVGLLHKLPLLCFSATCLSCFSTCLSEALRETISSWGNYSWQGQTRRWWIKIQTRALQTRCSGFYLFTIYKFSLLASRSQSAMAFCWHVTDRLPLSTYEGEKESSEEIRWFHWPRALWLTANPPLRVKNGDVEMSSGWNSRPKHSCLFGVMLQDMTTQSGARSGRVLMCVWLLSRAHAPQ